MLQPPPTYVAFMKRAINKHKNHVVPMGFNMTTIHNTEEGIMRGKKYGFYARYLDIDTLSIEILIRDILTALYTPG